MIFLLLSLSHAFCDIFLCQMFLTGSVRHSSCLLVYISTKYAVYSTDVRSMRHLKYKMCIPLGITVHFRTEISYSSAGNVLFVFALKYHHVQMPNPEICTVNFESHQHLFDAYFFISVGLEKSWCFCECLLLFAHLCLHVGTLVIPSWKYARHFYFLKSSLSSL